MGHLLGVALLLRKCFARCLPVVSNNMDFLIPEIRCDKMRQEELADLQCWIETSDGCRSTAQAKSVRDTFARRRRGFIPPHGIPNEGLQSHANTPFNPKSWSNYLDDLGYPPFGTRRVGEGPCFVLFYISRLNHECVMFACSRLVGLCNCIMW